MEIYNLEELAPEFYHAVWCIPSGFCCFTDPFMAYRYKKNNGEWVWRLSTGSVLMSLKPNEVSSWHRLTEKQRKEGSRVYEVPPG